MVCSVVVTIMIRGKLSGVKVTALTAGMIYLSVMPYNIHINIFTQGENGVERFTGLEHDMSNSCWFVNSMNIQDDSIIHIPKGIHRQTVGVLRRGFGGLRGRCGDHLYGGRYAQTDQRYHR